MDILNVSRIISVWPHSIMQSFTSILAVYKSQHFFFPGFTWRGAVYIPTLSGNPRGYRQTSDSLRLFSQVNSRILFSLSARKRSMRPALPWEWCFLQAGHSSQGKVVWKRQSGSFILVTAPALLLVPNTERFRVVFAFSGWLIFIEKFRTRFPRVFM